MRDYPCTHKAGCNLIFWELVGLQSLYLPSCLFSFLHFAFSSSLPFLSFLPSIFPSLVFLILPYYHSLLIQTLPSYCSPSFICLFLPSYLSSIFFLSFFLLFFNPSFVHFSLLLLDFSSFHFTFFHSQSRFPILNFFLPYYIYFLSPFLSILICLSFLPSFLPVFPFYL